MRLQDVSTPGRSSASPRASATDVTDSKVKPLIRSRLKTRQLALLVSLDDERCVARAAELNGLTQSAASKLLREVEAALNVKLFERHARGVAPTWYGEILVRHARQALSEISLAHDEIAALKSGLTGRAALGTVMIPGTDFVPTAIAQVKRRFPGILIRVEMDFSKPLVEKLLAGELDMLVARVPESGGAEELSFEPLASEPHSIIAGAHHPLAGRSAVQLEDLVDQGWILPTSGSLVRDKLVSSFLRRGLPLPVNIVETNSLPVVTSLLRTTNMIVALPVKAVHHYCEAGALAVLCRDLDIEIGSFGIVIRRDYKLSPGAQVMLNTLREAAADVYRLEPAAISGHTS
jgi:DNA-binding transcriptional LysR family regulator